MKGIKLSIRNISLVAFSLAFVLASFSTSYTASAVSEYDDYYNTTDELILTRTSCNAIDMSLDWSTYLGSYTASFETAVNNGSWGVSYFPNYDVGAGKTLINVYWNESSEMSLDWDDWPGYIYSKPTTKSIALEMGYYQNDCDVDTWEMGSATVSSNDGAVENYFFTGNPNYPTDYAGTNVRTDPPADSVIVRPQFAWDVEFKHLRIVDQSVMPNELPQNYKIHYIVTMGTFETPTYFYEQTISQGESVDIDFPDTGPVGIQAIFFQSDGTAPLEDTTDYDFRETDVTFEVDGSSFSGSTDGTVCDENDHCEAEEETKYEDCTEYNFLIKFWDTGLEWSVPSPATVGCAINQFWLKLMDFFAFIFNPNPGDMDNPFADFATETHGLADVVSAPFGIFTGLANSEYDCVTAELPLPYMSGALELPCMSTFYSNTIGGAFFSMYQTIVGGVISYYVLLGYLRLLKSAKDPNDDKIEVTKL